MEDAEREELRAILRLARGGPLQQTSAIQELERKLGSDRPRQTQHGEDHPPIPGYVVAPIEAPTRILVVTPGIVPAAAAGTVAFPLNFQGPGFGEMVGISGSVRNAAAAAMPLESCSVRVNLNGGSEELITTGIVAGFANMGDLFRDKTMYLPIRRLMTPDDIANFFFQNHDPAVDILPTISVFFIAERDRRSMGQTR